jgi:membrane-associated phospholipid phosphatase
MRLIKPMQMEVKLPDWIVLAGCVAVVGVLGASIDPRFPPAFDVEALTWIRSHLEGGLGDALIQIYRFSGVGFTAFLVLASIIYVVVKRWWNDLRLLVMASGGILVIIDLWLKPWFDRHRPPEKLLLVDGRSFPSGHAAGAVAFYGAMLLILAAHHPRWRTPLTIGACLWISLVWLSTLYVRAHWPTDLLAGAATGLAWLTLCKALWRDHTSRRSVQPPP